MQAGKPVCVQIPSLSHGETGFLVANVGNIDPVRCGGPFIYKLCLAGVEAAVAANLQALQPDVVFLQEVLHPKQCMVPGAAKPGTVCHAGFLAGVSHSKQIDRLLPPEFDRVCTPDQYECIGIRRNTGWSFKGALELIPPASGCDPGFSVSRIKVNSPFGPLTLVNAHPDSISASCRLSVLHQVFNETQGPLLLAGDFNLDPFAAADQKAGRPPVFDPSEDFWRQRVGEGKPFRYLSQNGSKPLVFTNPAGVLDHAATNSTTLKGHCSVLGRDGLPALDGGLKNLDHMALWCALSHRK